MAARIGRVINPDMKKIYTSPTEIWPIIACIGAALGWTGYMMTRAALGPDVSIDRVRRQSPVKAEFCAEEAQLWLDQRKKHIAKDVSKIRILESFERKFW